MRYTEMIEDPNRDHAFELLGKMEAEYERRNAEFFNKVLEVDPSLVIRVHAVTVLSEIGDQSSVKVLSDAMKNDPSPLIRHECAFSLGQMGLKSAIPSLIEAALSDLSEIVRHEAAAALGSIGDESSREALLDATRDPSSEVRGSALASLFNLDYLKYAANKKNYANLAPASVESRVTSRTKKMPHP